MLPSSGGQAVARELPRVEESDPTAVALGYVHDGSQIAEATRGNDANICLTCRFYSDPNATDWGPCVLFPGKSVAAIGWCRTWTVRLS